MKFYIRLVNDELPGPIYVERGLGFGGVKLTDSLRNARRYDSREEAEKIAALARQQKDKERGGESTTVEIVTEGAETSDGFELRARFEVPASGAESRFEMKKTPAGIKCRYVAVSGSVSREYEAGEMSRAVSDWTSSVGAWFAAKTGKAGK